MIASCRIHRRSSVPLARCPQSDLLLVISAGIAAFGLIANSAAVVIGAMLVSPLMTPIFGISLALSRGDLTLLRPALLAEFGGVALIIAFAFLIGDAHFAALSAEQKSQQATLQDAGRTLLLRLRNTSVESIDAAPTRDGWLVRAETAGTRAPTPSEVGAIEQHLAQLASTAVSFSVWASTELIVTKAGYNSVEGYIREQVLQRRQAAGAPAVAGETSGAPPPAP
jgi:hypothetical protein